MKVGWEREVMTRKVMNLWVDRWKKCCAGLCAIYDFLGELGWSLRDGALCQMNGRVIEILRHIGLFDYE